MSIRFIYIGNFGFWRKNIALKVFTTLWNLRSRIFRQFLFDLKCSKNTRSQVSKCCKTYLNFVFSTKTKISYAYEPNRHFPEDTSTKKLFSLECNFFSRDVTYPHTDQNGISDKSAKNAPTSPKDNFFENGRVRLVYDSFWPQGPPKLQKIGLGRFPQLVRPPWADLQISRIFLEISTSATDPRKTEFLDFRVRKKCSKNNFFKICLKFPKIWYLSSILVYLHRAYSQQIKNNNPLKS